MTGDQLLSTDPEEADRLGYVDRRQLGYVAAAAPVTGVLGVTGIDLGWARRAGRHSQASERALGAIEQPGAGEVVSRQAFEVNGVALFPPSATSRVEIRLDGQPAGNARLGLPRMDPATLRDHPGADVVLAGFQHHVTEAQLDPEAAEVRIDAVVVRLDGESFSLPSKVVALEQARTGPEDPGGRAAGLRERVANQIASAPPDGHPGLRVLVFPHQLEVGGAQRYLFELLDGLIEDAAMTCEVVAPETDVYEPMIESLGIPVHTSPGLGPGDAAAYEGRMLEVAAWAAPKGFDLVVANTVDSFAGVDLGKRLGLPVIWSLHESFDFAHWWAARYKTDAAFPYARERAELALREADAIVFAADATRRLYERYAPAERMVTLPYGIAVDEIDAYRARFDRAATRRRLGIAPDTRVVLSLGRLEPRKGQALVAQAFASLAEDRPDAVLVVVGDQPGRYSDALHEYLARAELGDRVRLEPISADPYAWHEAADVFVLGSDIESSPIVVLEALAFETPVVATAVFGVPETIEDGVSGYLCEPSDVSSLAAALERALDADAQARRELVKAGGRRVRDRHGAARYAREFRSLMDDLTAGRRERQRRSTCARVSVLIPTLNAGPGFERSLGVLRAQEGVGELEILVTDSESHDETVALARRAGAGVETVPASEFNHGSTRDALAERASGDFLLTTVQDATLVGPTALLELVEALESDHSLAAVSASQTHGPGADLFSRYEAWLRPRSPAGRGSVDNVCAVIRRSAWEQVRFGELEFGEDLDFGLRAREAGWTTTFSARELVAHHHDRPADQFLARAALHRLALSRRVDLDRNPLTEPGLERLLAALPGAAGQVQSAFDHVTADGVMTLARSLRRLSDALQGHPEAAEPEGELSLLAGLWPAGEPSEQAAESLRDAALAGLEFPWLQSFALAQAEPVERSVLATFVARLIGSALGQVLGDAMRDAPDSEPSLRLRDKAIRS